MHEHHHHHNSNHLHFHPSKENVDKIKILDTLTNISSFKGFDDFMYFVYKYWIVLKDNEDDINKVKSSFIEVCKKFKKLKDSEDINIVSNKLVENLDNSISLMLNHELEEVTSLIEKFVRPYTISEKFIRNFNKRVN
ncbi:MAG: hypothetical protein U0354_02340 [Candidatus Sericytochromatia bacterium]